VGTELSLFARAGVATTPTHLSLPLDLTFEDYENLGAMIGMIRDTSNWWLGEWLIQGERLYGDEMYQAVTATGRAPQTLINIASVCRRVPKSVRRERVSFSVHAEVAALTPQEQKHWLDEAEKRSLSKAELRSEIHANGDVHPAEQSVCPTCGRVL
jgi:hypothetical protein